MKPGMNHSAMDTLQKRTLRLKAFTMIEIAISIAIVGFALVALMGVLPTGMTVQKDNREDTIVNQEGMYWMEAIRGGARGMDDLTNYVEAVTISNALTGSIVYSNGPSSFLTGESIVGLLTTPKVIPGKTLGSFLTNRVTARVKAITGAAGEKGGLTNDFAFRYEIQAEVIPFRPTPYFDPTNTYNPLMTLGELHQYNMAANLHDIRLILRWPVFERGNDWAVGSGRKLFRTAVAGNLTARSLTNGVAAAGYFFHPNSFVNVTPQK